MKSFIFAAIAGAALSVAGTVSAQAGDSLVDAASYGSIVTTHGILGS